VAALPLLAVFGPTAVGKTAIALALADALRAHGEDPIAVSADALQVYAGLEALSGAPTAAERAHLEHRLVGIVPVTERFSVARYARMAHAEIDALRAGGARVIVVGGTGLYLRAALAELALRPAPEPGVRERWQAELDRHGAPALHRTLAARAPAAAQRMDARDGRRIVRALELLEADALSEPPSESQLWTRTTRHPTRLFGLVMEREALYARIDARAEAMAAGGARAEAQRALAAGVSETARQALGFEALLRGDVEAMKRDTRRYAKRQLTFMRKLGGVRPVDVTGREPAAVAAEILAAAGDP